MTYTGLSYGTGLAASAAAEGIHSSFSGTIGTPVAIGTYPGTQPDIAYSLRLEISAGETLEWNPLTGAVTGGDAERLYTRAGWQRVGVIPDYALMPDGELCATTMFHKRV